MWQFRSGRLWMWALIVAGCGGQKIDPTTASAGFRRLPSDQVILGFQQYVTESGVKKAVLFGDTAFVFEDSSKAQVQNVRLTLYDEKGNISAKLTSRSGDVNSTTRALIARGHVVLTTTEGRRIETEELHYDPNTHRVWSDVATVQHFQGGTISGTCFDADDKFNNVRVCNTRSTGGGLRFTF